MFIDTSNWMRFIRLAKQHQDQNLLLCDIDSKLYFRSCKFIGPKDELRVGYSREYAEKYNLPILTPKIAEKPAFVQTKYDEQFPADENPQNPLTELVKNESTANDNTNIKVPVPPAIIRTTPIKLSEAGSPVKSKHRLNTGAIRMRKLARSKNSRRTGPTVRYACCYCSKVFSKFLSYKKHTNAIHSVDIEHKRFTVDVEHKRLTIEDSNKIKDNATPNEPNKENDAEGKDVNAKKWYVCQKCQEYFSTAKKLEVILCTKIIFFTK